MYYEVTIKYTSGKISISNIEQHELSDTKGYINQGISGNWIKNYSIKGIREEY